MRVINYEDYRIGSEMPFTEAGIITYDGKSALTNGHLLFMNPADLPGTWNFQPHEKVKAVSAKPQTRMPACEFQTRPLVAVIGGGEGSMYFSRGQRVNARYFDAVMRVYPSAEWFAELDDINARLEAKINGATVAAVMPFHIDSFPDEIAHLFGHLTAEWYQASDDYTEIQTVNAVFKPFGGFKTTARLKDYLTERLPAKHQAKQFHLDDIAVLETDISNIAALIEKIV